MIDLHMHTTYSDGTDSVIEILEKAQKLNLEVISITDHNNCSAYMEMQNIPINKIYDGMIISGCEFTTSFKGRLIEVLGYGFDVYKLDNFLKSYYTNDRVETENNIIYNRFIDIIKNIGLIYPINNEKKLFNKNVEKEIYDELIKYPENREIINDDIFSSYSDFYRKGLTNPNSILFLNRAEFKLPLKDIIKIIHELEGISFLAHPYQYKFPDTESFLEEIYAENNFDGIECFYTTFTKKQIEYLLNFAIKRNLLVSGGSDYHGNNKKNHNLGNGRGNMNIKKKILSNWNINYFK